MTRRQWSFMLLMILVNYLVFSQLFSRIIDPPSSGEIASALTRTPNPTFTITPIPPSPTPVPSNTPAPVTSSPTSTSVLNPGPAPETDDSSPQSSDSPNNTSPANLGDTTPQVTAFRTAVNLREGPGTRYRIIGVLPQGQSLVIVGRNAAASWWQVRANERSVWIAASVTQSTNATVANIPLVAAPAPPPLPPTATPVPAPPQPVQPAQQYTIINIFGQLNEGITQIRGSIQDANDNAVNGARVRVRSGSFCTVSYPSGAPGGYPNGNYDILLDNRAKPGQWQVAVVNGPANPDDTQCNSGLAVLSEEITVETQFKESVIFVEWRKNY